MMMDEDDDDSDLSLIHLKSADDKPKRRRPKKIIIPRRQLSEVIEEPKPIILTAGIKKKPVKLNECLVSPLTLYELSAAVLDKLNYPAPFEWAVKEVLIWMNKIGFSQYKSCIIRNKIDGKRLLRLEDPSHLPEINIHNFKHIKKITSEVRKLFFTDYILFARSIGLPIRKPLTHCTWFKSRTGPSWGIRQNWTRSDILRWMKIIMPNPVYRNHWDLVWYENPDFPKVLFARIPKVSPDSLEHIPHYEPMEEFCNEYQTPRKFRLQTNIPEEAQLIWMEHRPESPSYQGPKSKVQKQAPKKKVVKESIKRLMPKSVSLTGLSGKDLILARRKRPRPKFLV